MSNNRITAFALALLALFMAGGLAYQIVKAQAQPAVAQAEETQVSEVHRTVSVTGIGRVSARPDVAVARLGVRTDAATAQEALSQNSQKGDE